MHFWELKNALAKTNSQVGRAQATVRNVLGCVRNMPPDMQPADLNALLKGTIAFLEPAFKQNDIECLCSFHQPLPLVFTHAETLQQILVNILANAIDAMSGGGRVEIVTSVQKDQAWIQITDNGPGINPEQQKHIFEPFVTSKNEKKGTGLGLWICSQLTEKIHGTILLQKSDPTGTTFVVTIPLANQDRASHFLG